MLSMFSWLYVHVLALEREGGIIHLLSRNLCLLGRLRGKNCHFWRCHKSITMELIQISVLKKPIQS